MGCWGARPLTGGMTENAADTANTQRMTVVVTGASGRTGSRVARAARGAGLTVRAASRARGFDWQDPTTWAQILRGADGAYLMYPSDIGSPAAAQGIGALAREAVGLGVRRLVLLSARGEDHARPAEEALKSSGADWTIVRAAWFSQNFSEGPLVAGMVHGELVFPADQVEEPFVDVRDIADVVVAVLTAGAHHVGRTLELTGPRLLSWRSAVAEISEAAGSTITYTPVPVRAYGEALTGFGVPPEEVDLLMEVFEALMDGRNAHVTTDVREVLGREPRDFGGFAREAAAAGVWKA